MEGEEVFCFLEARVFHRAYFLGVISQLVTSYVFSARTIKQFTQSIFPRSSPITTFQRVFLVNQTGLSIVLQKKQGPSPLFFLGNFVICQSSCLGALLLPSHIHFLYPSNKTLGKVCEAISAFQVATLFRRSSLSFLVFSTLLESIFLSYLTLIGF